MRALLAVVVVLAGCGKDLVRSLEPDAGPIVSPDGRILIDRRVPIPPTNPAYADIVTPEAVVEAGEERMFCYHFANPYGELSVDQLVGIEPLGGHHTALFTTPNPKPEGTFEDCTPGQSNEDLRWFILQGGALPAGFAISIPSGKQLVIQVHYQNAADAPILVRNVVRLHLVDPGSVEHWTATMVAANPDLSLPPGSSSITWDCTLAGDRDLVAVFGHMHEYGSFYELSVGPSADALTTMMTVNPWLPSYRETPPFYSYYDAPIHLTAGTVLRTTCSWTNPGATPILFPTEMCFSFMYLAGDKVPVQCVRS